MATPEVTPPNVAELTPQQIADQLAQASTGVVDATTEPQPLPQGLEVKTSTGAVFRGRDWQEIATSMQKSVEHGSQYITELKQQLAEARQPPPAASTPRPPENQFDSQRYYETWAQAPLDAEYNAVNTMLQQRYGFSLDQFAAAMQQNSEFTARAMPRAIASEWQVTSDFPTSDPEQLEKASTALEQVWNEFFPNDPQITPQKLEMAHAVAVRRGMYEPEARNQAAPAPQQASPMPTLNTGSSGGVSGQPDVNRMSPEQLRALIDQLPR